MRIFRLFLVLFSLGAIPAPATAQTAAERQQLAWVEERGQLLFDLDRAAWVATDDLLERWPEAGNAGARGYIVEHEGRAYIVTFFGDPETNPVAYYRGRVENHRVVDRQLFQAADRPALTVMQRRLARVRSMGGLGRRPCGNRPFNTAVIPPSTPDGPIDLYLLTPQVNRGEYPLGGHYRFTIAADGSVLSSRAFANTCLTTGRPPDIRPGERPFGLGVTHLLDPIPTEIHVFTALTSGLMVGVATNDPDRTWLIEMGRIRLLEETRANTLGAEAADLRTEPRF